MISGTTYYDWKIILSSNPSVPKTQSTWGVLGDYIAISDYDGDGKDDIAIYRDSTAQYWVIQSAPPYTAGVWFTYGGYGEVPIMADFDRDGKTDRALYYDLYGSGNGVWDVILSGSCNHTAPPSSCTHYGAWIMSYAAGDIPLVGDYVGGGGAKGDGHPDFMIFRPSTGYWYIQSYGSGGITESTQWGLPGDVPIVGDYNGDGMLDYVVYRPSNGNWYIKLRGVSAPNNQRTVQWGFWWGSPTPDLVPTNQLAR